VPAVILPTHQPQVAVDDAENKVLVPDKNAFCIYTSSTFSSPGKNNSLMHWWYFVITLIFIILPGVVMSTWAGKQYLRRWQLSFRDNM